MDKQVMEMAKVIKNCATEMVVSAAERLYNEGYRNYKDKVVLSNEEYSALLSELKRLVERVDRISCRYVLKEEARKETVVNKGAKMINRDTYKRFTELKTYNNGKKMYVQYSVSGCYNDMNRKGDYTTGDSVDRLAELEDKIMDGRLVELPCKVGDTLYFLQYYCDNRGCSEKERFYCCGCKEMITRERNNEIYVIATKNCEWNDIPAIGKKYFVTKAEAEARLKELQADKQEAKNEKR